VEFYNERQASYIFVVKVQRYCMGYLLSGSKCTCTSYHR